MIAFELFDWLLLVLFVAAAVALSFGPYALARRLFHRRVTEHTYDLAGSVLFRIGALHALILALMFAHVTGSFLELRNDVTEEAAATADVWRSRADKKHACCS